MCSQVKFELNKPYSLRAIGLKVVQRPFSDSKVAISSSTLEFKVIYKGFLCWSKYICVPILNKIHESIFELSHTQGKT